MAWSICFFVADSADAQLAYLRVVVLLLLVLLEPPHAARMDSIPPKEMPSASARTIKSRRPILPSVKSCMSLFVSFIDITPIVVRIMTDDPGFRLLIGVADLELDRNSVYAGK